MATLLQVGKKYSAKNVDGVEVIGVITKVQAGRVEFGVHGRLYLIPQGWTFTEID